MKSALFASPNLKVILAGAALVALLQQTMESGEGSDLQLVSQRGAAAISRNDVERMMNRTFDEPTSLNYEQLSQVLLQCGDIKAAMFYSRKASLAAEIEE